MNRLKILLLISLLLPGCALLDAYNMAEYDNNEYYLVNKIRTESEVNINTCSNQKVSSIVFNELYEISTELKNFAQYIPDNEDTFKLASGLVELTKQGKETYDNNDAVSVSFCKLKLKSINRAAEKAQEVIGNKPR
jgi:hypothetical protein